MKNTENLYGEQLGGTDNISVSYNHQATVPTRTLYLNLAKTESQSCLVLRFSEL